MLSEEDPRHQVKVERESNTFHLRCPFHARCAIPIAEGTCKVMLASLLHHRKPSDQGRCGRDITCSMRIPSVLLALAAIILSTQRADARSWMDGMRLLHECELAIRTADGDHRLTPDDDASSSHCIGYVQGVIDTNALWDEIDKRDHQTNRPHYCVKQATGDVSLEQIIRIVVEWAKTHPKDLNDPGWVTIQGALLNAFPCKP
jgi:hypothetical protein